MIEFLLDTAVSTTPPSEHSNIWMITTIVLAIIGTLEKGWKYLKQKDNNETSLKLAERKSEDIRKDELTLQYNELLKKFNELEEMFEETKEKLDKALIAFDVILPIIESMIEEKPEYKRTIQNALKHIKQD